MLCIGFVGLGRSATERPVMQLYRPAPVAAYGGVLATSIYDPATRRYSLVVRSEGQTRHPPIPTRAVPFDIDAGPSEDGSVVLAYSRCRTEPVHVAPTEQLPTWSTGRGCDVFRFSLRTGHERKLQRASTRSASEYLPSISGDRVVFARVYERRGGRRGRYPYLYAGSLRHGSSHRLPGGPRGRGGYENGPAALDLYGRRVVAFVWSRFIPRDARPNELNPDTGLRHDELRIDELGGRGRRIDVTELATVNKRVRFVSVQGDQGALYYAQECTGECPARYSRRLWRYSPVSRRRTVAVLPARSTSVADPGGSHEYSDVYLSTVRDRGRVFAVRGPYGAPAQRPPTHDWKLVQLTGLSFAEPR